MVNASLIALLELKRIVLIMNAIIVIYLAKLVVEKQKMTVYYVMIVVVQFIIKTYKIKNAIRIAHKVPIQTLQSALLCVNPVPAIALNA